jgi:hypothetical protein
MSFDSEFTAAMTHESGSKGSDDTMGETQWHSVGRRKVELVRDQKLSSKISVHNSNAQC